MDDGFGPWNVNEQGDNVYAHTSHGGHYELIAHLENPNDPARCGIKDYLHVIDDAGDLSHWHTAFGGMYSNQIYSTNDLGP